MLLRQLCTDGLWYPKDWELQRYLLWPNVACQTRNFHCFSLPGFQVTTRYLSSKVWTNLRWKGDYETGITDSGSQRWKANQLSPCIKTARKKLKKRQFMTYPGIHGTVQITYQCVTNQPDTKARKWKYAWIMRRRSWNNQHKKRYHCSTTAIFRRHRHNLGKLPI